MKKKQKPKPKQKQKFFTIIAIGITTSLGLASIVHSLEDSVGENGIDAFKLQQPPYNLQGRKVSIGQIEVGRPKKFALDKLSALHKKLPIKRLFYRNQAPVSNTHIDNHAQMVSGVMVSNEKRLTGVAPLANLYVGAIGSLKTAKQPEECLTTQNIALQDSDNVSAINLSFGESLARDDRTNPVLDGNALFTQCLDWSARVHNVVYVVAGNQGRGGIPIPTDNYNGITTGYSRLKDGVFRKVDFANLTIPPVGIDNSFMEDEINIDNRRSISLIAPGHKIAVYNVEGRVEKVTGSSFAAPHVTATIALLQEAGNRLLSQKHPRWTADFKQHEVIKAILLNSADKLKDRGDGNLLGMTREVVTQRNDNWFNSPAYQDPQIPLHMQIGAGHLNALRAYNQMIAGQWDVQEKIPTIGWSYTSIVYQESHDYEFQSELKGDSFIAITLTWDRLVELKDQNNNQKYDLGERFIDRGLNNLDLELISQTDGSKVVCSSVSKVDSVEHIFCKIPETDKYTIRVKFKEKISSSQQKYSLAWHGVAFNN